MSTETERPETRANLQDVLSAWLLYAVLVCGLALFATLGGTSSEPPAPPAAQEEPASQAPARQAGQASDGAAVLRRAVAPTAGAQPT